MKSKLKGIFKNLSAMFLLLIVVTAVFIPLGAAKALGLGDLISFDIFSIITEFIASAMIDEEGFLWPIYFLVYHFFNLCLLAVTILVYFGAWLVDVFLDEDIYIRVLDMTDKTSAVYIGWTTVRDACNTFFILFLLLIAFSTILRIQAYNAKNLLPKLIISLFLINFSAIIAMMVIDLGQVFMFEIKTWMGAGFSEGGKPLTSIVDYFNSEYDWKDEKGDYNLANVVGVAFAVAYSVILGLLYIMLALFLMVRIVVFVILIIISPFAFFSIILPGMRTYTSQWWSSLVSHAIFGPIFLFFIFLSGKMAQSMQTFEPIEANDEISSLSYIVAELIPHVVALALLAAAIPVTQKLGAAGSSKIIGGAAGMGKVAVGTYAGIKLAGGLGKKVGGGVASRNDFVGRNVDKVKGKYYEGLEKYTLGLGRGAAMKGKASIEKGKEEKMKRLEVDFGDLKSIDLNVLEKKAKGKLGTTDDKALWLKAAAVRGELGKHEKTAKEFMTGAERSLSGKEVSEITDKNLVLATKTSEAQRSGKTDEEIMKEKMNDIVENGEAHKVQGLGNSAMATKVWHDGQTGEARKSNMNRMNEKQRGELAEGYMLNIKKTEGLEDEALREAEEDNVEFSSNAVKLGKGLEESFAWGGDDAAEKIKKAFSEFDHKDVAKMSADDLDNHGYSAANNQITGLNKAGEYKAVRRIYASMAKHDPERYNREKNKPINPGPDKGSGGGSGGGGGTKAEEPGKKWEEKMKEKTGGGGARGSGSGESSKKNKKSFLGDENAEANLTSAIPKKTKREKEGGGKAKKDRGSRAAIIDDADTNKPRRSFWKDESASVGLTGGVKSKTTTDKKAETEPHSEKTGAKKAVDSYEEHVREKAIVDLSLENVKKKVVEPAIETYKEKAPPVIVATDKVIGKALDIASVDKRVAAANIVLKPIINEEIKVNEERRDGAEVSKKEELERKVKRVGRELKPTVSKNAGKGVKVAGDEAGAALKKIEKRGGKIGAAAKVIRPVVESKYVQEKVSKEVRKKVNDKEDKKPEAQKTENGTEKQQTTKEAKPETVVKTKSAPVVKTEITSKSNVGREMSEQIRKALEEVSRDMKQEITNNIAVNSSQEAVDIDFEKIIDVNKIAELVEKGIDMKDVEKNLKDVKKSFDKFKENNSGNADTTVFGAGISVARAALNEAQNREDHKEQAVELATIENVLGEIKSEMKKQDKSSIEEEK